MDKLERLEHTFTLTDRECELFEFALSCRISKLAHDIEEYDALNSLCMNTSSKEDNDFHLREVAALRSQLIELRALYDRFFTLEEGGAADEK